MTGIQCIDNKLYYFNADGVLENGKTFGVDVSKYQKNIDWNQIKKAGVSFVIVRIGYRGYGASGTLVLDPMFEEHFTNVKNAGLKVGVYFFSQATTEEEAKEEAFACAYVLNASWITPSSLTPKHPALPMVPAAPTVWVWRTAPSAPSPSVRRSRHRATNPVCMPLPCGTASVSI